MEISRYELSGRYTFMTLASDFLTSYLILLLNASCNFEGVLD